MDSKKMRFKKAFESNFGKYKDGKIALYGLGKRTREILSFVEDYEFIVTANEGVGSYFEGYEVYEIKEALTKVDMLIIVALPKSIEAIWERLQRQCIGMLDKVDVWTINGHKLGKRVKLFKEDIKKQLNQKNQHNDLLLWQLCQQNLSFDHKGKVYMHSYQELGYLCFGPMMILMLEKIIELASKDKCIFLLSSRDCWLLFELIQSLGLKQGFHYIYVSRCAMALTDVYSLDDIERVIQDIFRFTRGNIRLMCEERFGISFASMKAIGPKDLSDIKSEIELKQVVEAYEHFVLDHQAMILEGAQEARKNYQAYVDQFDFGDKESIYFVDLVTKGSNYSSMLKFMRSSQHLKLFCLGYKDEIDGFVDESDVISVYPPLTIFSSWNLSLYYQLLEVAFSSKENQLKEINKYREAVFSEGTSYAFPQVEFMQMGIRIMVHDYFLKRQKTAPLDIRLADMMLGLVKEDYSSKVVDFSEGFSYKDAYSGDPDTNIWKRFFGKNG